MPNLRARLQQVMEPPRPIFQAFEPSQAAPHHIYITTHDATDGEQLRFRLPQRKANPHTPQEVANAAASELHEGRGLIHMVEWRSGWPVFSATFASNATKVFCVWSTDPDRAPIAAVARDILAGKPPRFGLQNVPATFLPTPQELMHLRYPSAPTSQ